MSIWKLSVLTYEEDGDWIARCLDMDIAGSGPTREKAVDNLAQAMSTHMEAALEHGLNVFRPAPFEYWEAFYAEHSVESIREDLQLALST